MPKLSPTPWEYENVSQCSERGGYAVVKDATGKVLFGSENSDVAEIHVEHDTNGATYTDEQGRVNLTLAAAAPDMLAVLIAVRDYARDSRTGRVLTGEGYAAIDAAIEKATKGTQR